MLQPTYPLIFYYFWTERKNLRIQSEPQKPNSCTWQLDTVFQTTIPFSWIADVSQFCWHSTFLAGLSLTEKLTWKLCILTLVQSPSGLIGLYRLHKQYSDLVCPCLLPGSFGLFSPHRFPNLIQYPLYFQFHVALFFSTVSILSCEVLFYTSYLTALKHPKASLLTTFYYSS